VPAAQAEQSDLPVADWNLPAAQAVQMVAPAALYMPTVQAMQDARSVAAEVAR